MRIIAVAWQCFLVTDTNWWWVQRGGLTWRQVVPSVQAPRVGRRLTVHVHLLTETGVNVHTAEEGHRLKWCNVWGKTDKRREHDWKKYVNYNKLTCLVYGF